MVKLSVSLFVTAVSLCLLTAGCSSTKVQDRSPNTGTGGSVTHPLKAKKVAPPKKEDSKK